MHTYRNPNGTGQIRVVVPETGHVALVGPEGKKLPSIYHNAAIAAGCECDAPTLKREDVKPQASPDAKTDKAPAERIKDALKTMLERDVEGDFTKAGDPNLNVVSQLAGLRATRKDVGPIFAELKAEAEAEAEAGDGAGDDAGDGDGAED